MRLLILISAIFLTGQAIADTEFTVKPDRIEMKTAVKEEADDATEDKDSAPATKAQDYNSSRSNTTRLMDATPAQDYNNSRSNNLDSVAVDDDSDDDSIPVEDEAPANHNTTRQR